MKHKNSIPPLIIKINHINNYDSKKKAYIYIFNITNKNNYSKRHKENLLKEPFLTRKAPVLF